MALRPLLSKARRDERGTAAIEFAAIASFLTIIFIGLTDVSRLALAAMRVRYAAEAGATYAINNASDITSTDSTRSTAALQAIVTAAAAATSASVTTQTPTVVTGCATSTGIVATTASTCAATGSAAAPGKYVVVTSQMSYTVLFQPAFITYPNPVSHTLRVRVK